MCGIFGFVGKRERAASIDLNVALKALHHRGPDDSGKFFSASRRNPDVACAFAHTRLSIIDLSAAGHQPMTTEDGRYTIVYNGEIYNFRDIRNELERDGDRFGSSSDTEVVLKAFARWGAEAVKHLRGMFAIAIWDADRNSLFLARDRLGVKPLYYTQLADGFAFASEVRVLMDCGVADRKLSEEGLNSYLAFGSASEPLTIVEGVLAAAPGSCIETNGSVTNVSSYWMLPVGPAVDGPHSVRSVTRSAVLMELEADVPVGVFLSGGLDSSTIVSIASARAATPIHTFTVTFDEDRYNEEKFAAEVAARFGCDHHQVHISEAQAMSDMDAALAALDQPSADGLNTFLVAKAAREAGLSVALSGLGGDEVFAGYRHFRSFRSLIALGRVGASFGGVFPEAPSDLGQMSTRMRKIRQLLRSSGQPPAVYATIRALFNDHQVSALQPASNRNGHRPTTRLESPGEDPDLINLLTRLELVYYLRNTLLRDADAMSMANSLEVRVPLLDHVVVETILGIPGSRKLSRRINKPLLLEAADKLPRSVVGRSKMGFTVPLESWLRGMFKPRVTEMLTSGVVKEGGVLDWRAVAEVWNAFNRGEKYMNYARVWCLVALIAWCEKNRMARA